MARYVSTGSEVRAVAECPHCHVTVIAQSRDEIHIDEVLLEAQWRQKQEEDKFWQEYEKARPRIDAMRDAWKRHCGRFWISIFDERCKPWAETNGYGELLELERNASIKLSNGPSPYRPVLYLICGICGRRAYIGRDKILWEPQIPPEKDNGGSEHMAEVVNRNPAIQGGIPCITGTRVPVFVILDYLADGHSIPEILDAFPHLTEEQVKGAIGWVSQQITIRGGNSIGEL